MKASRTIWKVLREDESGQDLIEYALIAGLIGLVAITTLKSLATSITAVLNKVQAALTAAGT